MSKMSKRTCRLCKIEKDLELYFYKNNKGVDGFDRRCKECHCITSRNRLHNTYDPKKARKKSIKRRKSGRAKLTTYRMIEKYPEKYKARYTFRNAVSKGIIKKKPCRVCKEPKSEGHHPDYSQPLKIIWLCKKHHAELHRKLKKSYQPLNSNK